MKVKMLTIMAGPDGVHLPGQIYDLPESLALQLIKNKNASVAVSPPAVAPAESTTEVSPPVEVADAPAKIETAEETPVDILRNANKRR